MTDTVKCLIKVNNLPDEFNPSGKYLVIRYCGDALWYYGTYKEKHRADYALMEIGNGFIVELVKRGGFDDRTIEHDREAGCQTEGMAQDGAPFMGSP